MLSLMLRGTFTAMPFSLFSGLRHQDREWVMFYPGCDSGIGPEAKAICN